MVFPGRYSTPFFMPGSGNLRCRKSTKETQPEPVNIEDDALGAEQIDVGPDQSGAQTWSAAATDRYLGASSQGKRSR